MRHLKFATSSCMAALLCCFAQSSIYAEAKSLPANGQYPSNSQSAQVPKKGFKISGKVVDIGKDISGIVFICNGFEVIDLGVMVEIANPTSGRHLVEVRATDKYGFSAKGARTFSFQ